MKNQLTNLPKANLTLSRIEDMLKDQEIGEWEYIDLLKRYIARREKAMKEGN
jgi:hypothetical protein